MGSLKSFEELECWKQCRKVKMLIFEFSSRLPKEEKYDIKSNINRAARSTTRNIAEGFGRYHHKENMQFCRISKGSLYELIDDLITSKDSNLIGEEEYKNIRQEIETAIKILNGYINYLSKLSK